MIKSNIKATFKSDIKSVWGVVTNNYDCSWRSDISKIEVLENGNKFIEYTRNGFPTTFYVTKREEYKCYEFNIENKNIKGYWRGIFKKTENNETKIDFTEEIQVNNPLMKLFAKSYLKKQQQTYINDLKKKLSTQC